MTAPVTSRMMLSALYGHFAQRYACLTEITTVEHEPVGGHPLPRDRRCDLLLISRTERIAVEVKVTRGDFRQDVADSSKQAAWVRLTHRQAYAVPAGLVTPDEVPEGFGLLVVEGRLVRWARRAPKRPGHFPEDLPERITYALLHRLAAAEAKSKGYGWSPTTEDVGELRAQVERLRRDAEIARNKQMSAEQRCREWQKRFATAEAIPCETCRQPLVPGGRRDVTGWKHRPEDEAFCFPLREAVQRANGYSGRYVPGPAPTDALAEDVAS